MPMQKPRLLNKAVSGQPPGAVYIGRPGKWGNPFIIGRDGTRSEIIRKYTAWLCDNPALAREASVVLRGKDLVCWCYPLPCHGNILLEIANSETKSSEP